MSSLPHPLPSRTAQNIAALYGHEDETLVAWQRCCTQAAGALRPQHDPERLSKALALAQGGHVMLDDDGYALVTSGATRYQVQADGVCDCPDYQHRGAPCKHVLAVLIHTTAHALVAPRPSPAPAASAPAKPTRQAKPRHSAAWDVHEAPVSSCFKIRVGAFEWTHTMRATDDAELHTRVQAFVPTFREIVAALDVLQAEREAVKAAPATPASQPTGAPADLQALLQQAVQQALAAQGSPNGQAPGTPPPAPPSNGTAQPAPTPEGWCALHQAPMELRSNERGSWWSHRLADGSYCKGK